MGQGRGKAQADRALAGSAEWSAANPTVPAEQTPVPLALRESVRGQPNCSDDDRPVLGGARSYGHQQIARIVRPAQRIVFTDDAGLTAPAGLHRAYGSDTFAFVDSALDGGTIFLFAR